MHCYFYFNDGGLFAKESFTIKGTNFSYIAKRSLLNKYLITVYNKRQKLASIICISDNRIQICIENEENIYIEKIGILKESFICNRNNWKIQRNILKRQYVITDEKGMVIGYIKYILFSLKKMYEIEYRENYALIIICITLAIYLYHQLQQALADRANSSESFFDGLLDD